MIDGVPVGETLPSTPSLRVPIAAWIEASSPPLLPVGPLAVSVGTSSIRAKAMVSTPPSSARNAAATGPPAAKCLLLKTNCRDVDYKQTTRNGIKKSVLADYNIEQLVMDFDKLNDGVSDRCKLVGIRHGKRARRNGKEKLQRSPGGGRRVESDGSPSLPPRLTATPSAISEIFIIVVRSDDRGGALDGQVGKRQRMLNVTRSGGCTRLYSAQFETQRPSSAVFRRAGRPTNAVREA